MAKSKEFEPSAYAAPGGPSSKENPQSDMGASVINYGEQRFGVGVSDEEGRDYAEPGDEGKIAVGLMKESGGISASGSYPEGTSDGITG